MSKHMANTWQDMSLLLFFTTFYDRMNIYPITLYDDSVIHLLSRVTDIYQVTKAVLHFI